MSNLKESGRDKDLYISNEITKTRYKLSLPTQKLLLFLISEIEYEERKTGVFLKERKYALNKIYDFFKNSGRKNDKNLRGHLINCINELKSNSITILEYQDNNPLKEMRYTDYPWYSKIKIDEEDNQFIFKFNNEIHSLLLNLKSYYFKSNIKEYLNLKSMHAIDLYILLRAEEYVNQKKKYPLEYLKKQLKLEHNKGYDRWNNFKNEVLEKAISQLNKETNYFFSYDIERVGRKVGFVVFTMIEKRDIKKLSELVTEHFEKLLKEQKLLSLFNEKKLYNIIYKYDPIEDKLTLDLSKTTVQPKYIEGFDSWLQKIDFAKKITSKIFRKSTVITFVTK